MNNTKIMRVPLSFHNLIKDISAKRNVDMTRTLRDSEIVIYNADKLTELIWGRKKLI